MGGGCATFIKKGLQYRRIEIITDLECIVVEIWSERGKIYVINYYNPGLI